MLNMYAVKDDVVGSFNYFTAAPNDDVAIRSFRIAGNAPDVPVTDLSLYRICNFDTDTAGIIPDLEFLCRGERLEV